MTCIKTGCHIFLPQYGEFAYGDAHEFDGVFVFRLVGGPSRSPLASTLHFTVPDISEWFNRHSPEMSTLIASCVENHGYEGKPLAQE